MRLDKGLDNYLLQIQLSDSTQSNFCLEHQLLPNFVRLSVSTSLKANKSTIEASNIIVLGGLMYIGIV